MKLIISSRKVAFAGLEDESESGSDSGRNGLESEASLSEVIVMEMMVEGGQSGDLGGLVWDWLRLKWNKRGLYGGIVRCVGDQILKKNLLSGEFFTLCLFRFG